MPFAGASGRFTARLAAISRTTTAASFTARLAFRPVALTRRGTIVPRNLLYILLVVLVVLAIIFLAVRVL